MSVSTEEAFDAIKYLDNDTLKEYLDSREMNAKTLDIYEKMFATASRYDNADAMLMLIKAGVNPDNVSSDSKFQANNRSGYDTWNVLFNGRKMNYDKFKNNDREESC